MEILQFGYNGYLSDFSVLQSWNKQRINTPKIILSKFIFICYVSINRLRIVPSHNLTADNNQ